MKEQEIIDLGFVKECVSEEESGANAFYYYYYKIGNIGFISNCNDTVSNGSWNIEILEGGIMFHDIIELEIVINLFIKNKIP
jgi:hypothetical protein